MPCTYCVVGAKLEYIFPCTQTMRGSTFAADNHVRAVQSNHVKNRRPPEDPNGIEYLPEALPPATELGGGGGGGGAGGRPPYIKYNSFAHY